MAHIEHSLFEEGFLVNSIGQVAQRPEVAIAELVANAWDAGATRVDIEIPPNLQQRIAVSDDGVGLDAQLFRERWMKLGYRRVKHQGEYAEFPPERSDWKRRAYGRNGAGRHGMLCFANSYKVLTLRYDSADAREFTVAPSSGANAFDLLSDEPAERLEHGTTVYATLEFFVPNADDILHSLSFKFLHDPQFTISVNGRMISVDSHPAIAQTTLKIDDTTTVAVRCISVPPSKKRHAEHGVAFWVGGKSVGEPTFSLHDVPLLDGRTAVANRHMIVVTTDDLFDEVLPDWSGFKKTDRVVSVAEAVGRYVTKVTAELMASRIQDNKTEAIRGNVDDFRKLRPLAQLEVTQFVDDLMAEHPTLRTDILTAAVKAAVNLEKSRSGQSLLEKLATISLDDVERINALLDNWTLKDALAVLNEIDRRLCVVETLEKLMGDSSVDELHSIHPLVTQARWLFGPEYESPEYASNVTISTAAERVFKRRIDPSGIQNPRQRPDLVFCKDATYSLTGVESFDGSLVKMRTLLLIELKKGRSHISTKQVQQSVQYVVDLLNCGLLDGSPFVHAFVVGHTIDKRAKIQQVGMNPVEGTVIPVTFSQLIRTADQRLFKLRDRISDRYKNIPGMELVKKILGQHQPGLFENDASGQKSRRRRKPAGARR